MNKNKKLLWLLIPFFLIVSTLMWKGNDKGQGKITKIGIIQFVQHEALDASRNGFIEGLKECGFKGEFIYKNAQGDQSNCISIAHQFVNEKVDLILAIATPAAQSVAAVTHEIPILVTAVTNPEEVGLVKSNENPQTNVSGTSDLAPIEKQIKLIKDLKPEAQKIAILFSNSEANSKYQSDIAVKEAEKVGLQSQVATFSQSSEVRQVVESLIGKVDAIFTPTDSTVASNMDVIAKTAMQGNIPVICGDVNLLSKGSVGTVGVDYYELGKLTSNQANDILSNNKKTSDMPIQYLENAKLVLNTEIIKKLNLREIPS